MWKQLRITASLELPVLRQCAPVRTAYYKVVGSKLLYAEPTAASDLETAPMTLLEAVDGVYTATLAKHLGAGVTLDSVALILSGSEVATLSSAYNGGAAVSETFAAQSPDLLVKSGLADVEPWHQPTLSRWRPTARVL